MRILIISQYHPPEMGAAATRWSDYARILADLGHEVFVISEVPNYPSGTIPKDYIGGNRFKLTRDSQNKYCLLRVPVWTNPRRNTIQRMGFFLSFMISATMAAMKIRRFDKVIVTSPPLFVGVVGIFLHWFKRNQIILDLRDLWPESAVTLGELKNPLAILLGTKLEKLVYRTVDKFLLAVPGFKNHLAKINPHYEELSLSLMNGIEIGFFKEAGEIVAQRETEPFTVLYAGNFGLAQNLEIIINAANELKHEPIRFLLIGDGTRRSDLEAQIKSSRLSNIELRAPVARHELISILRSTHIGVVPLINSLLFLNAIPSKLLEYMACELPCIVSIKGEVEQLVLNSESGICIPPEDGSALAEKIHHLMQHPDLRTKMGRAGREYVGKYLIKQNLLNDVISIIED